MKSMKDNMIFWIVWGLLFDFYQIRQNMLKCFQGWEQRKNPDFPYLADFEEVVLLMMSLW